MFFKLIFICWKYEYGYFEEFSTLTLTYIANVSNHLHNIANKTENPQSISEMQNKFTAMVNKEILVECGVSIYKTVLNCLLN